MLLCGIINELEKLPATNTTYFFYQATDTQINTATAVLRGLVYLLIEQQPSLIRHIQNKYDQARKQLFEDANAWVALSTIFNNILQDIGLSTTYLAVDALDECDTGLDDLINGLAEENGYESSKRDMVKRYFMQNAGDTFLWVALVCKELANLSEWDVDEESLSIFPPGLDGLYKRMLDQINVSRRAKLFKSILATLSIAYRPITLDELPSLVEIPQGAVGKDKALKEIIGNCGSFLSLRDQTIYFTHQSAKDFLTKEEPQAIFPNGEEVEHQAILIRSISAMSKILHKDIYGLQYPGISIEEGVVAGHRAVETYPVARNGSGRLRKRRAFIKSARRASYGEEVDAISANPYEGLFQVDLELDQNRAMVTDLTRGSKNKETWVENLNCIVCGAHLS
ncbi:hypothetical protein F5883DRAFT_660811 [Diaporthe sp. PMI_573]|nr:hypothetical protein F5883DRAFT_660811 [Diaporthaceae sp. PMI_573]